MNKNLINEFSLFIEQIKLDIDFSSGKNQIKNMFRLKAVQKVLSVIEKFNKNITSSEQLKGIKGIGKKSLLRIDEILKTGKLSEVKINKDSLKYLKTIEELEEVFGIGRKKAYELFKKHSIVSIEELQKKVNNKEIELPDNIIKGLKYVNKIKEKIPREHITKINNVLKNTLLSIDSMLFGLICGSYRREKSTSNDVDFIIVHTKLITQSDVKKSKINYLNKFITELKKNGLIIESLTSDDVLTKYMGIGKLTNGEYFRLDLRFVPYESFYPAILYFTGSKDLNKKMRQIAINLNYTLNEYGLFNNKTKKSIKIKSEKDVFDFLGLEYLEPIYR